MAIVTPEPNDHAYPSRPIQGQKLRRPPPVRRYLGKHIRTICHNQIISEPHQNHCAHFVCHVMGYDHIPGAAKCSTFGRHDVGGVHIRVNEVFNVAPNRRIWGPTDVLVEPCLAVATVTANLQAGVTVGDNRRKHIGLYTEGLIWHYSTDHGRVFADTPAAWRTRMTNAYGDHGQRPVSLLSAGLFL